ncbi:MAG: arsenite methyltransferase [Thermoproteota archaeon]|nr:arsenite methyltransferase [Thermoproteota archaeon]
MKNENHLQQQQDIKNTIRKTYGKIALQESNSESGSSSSSCCAPGCCSGGGGTDSPKQIAAVIGYDTNELESIPQASILGVGCGAPVNFANLHKGETVVDLGSGAGIDVFLSAKKVTEAGRVIGIDMTDEMLERARRNAKEHGFTNVDFRKGDIEQRIPVDDSSVDVVISNCVINLTVNKVDAFKEIYRILKPGGGRMVISDLVTDTEIAPSDANAQMWSSCIDGALTKEHYIDSIRQAGFQKAEVLSEQLYMDDEGNQVDGKRRKITSLVIKAVKK